MSRRCDAKEKLSLTPMIDVVFLLLIFFIVTISPRDLLSAPSVTRPAPGSVAPVVAQIFQIRVDSDGYLIGSVRFRGADGLAKLRGYLARVGKFDPEMHVTIITTDESSHSLLVGLLDTCYAVGLSNLALMSGT
jgi:biopolymer transport protein ExbD